MDNQADLIQAQHIADAANAAVRAHRLQVVEDTAAARVEHAQVKHVLVQQALDAMTMVDYYRRLVAADAEPQMALAPVATRAATLPKLPPFKSPKTELTIDDPWEWASKVTKILKANEIPLKR